MKLSVDELRELIRQAVMTALSVAEEHPDVVDDVVEDEDESGCAAEAVAVDDHNGCSGMNGCPGKS
jgi:hypothetical protein